MRLKIVAKLSDDDQKGIGELLDFQVPILNSHKDFADIIHRFLKFVLFSDKHCVDCRQ